jgi:hypothetical protein
MNMRIVAAAVLALLATQARPCTIVGYETFVPNIEQFERKQDGQGNIARLPRPIPKLIRVQRGAGTTDASCNDAGLIELELAWPTSSEYELDEIGFYFRVVAGTPPDLIFPLIPITGRIERHHMQFVFAWLDQHPSKQLPLDLRVEVFAVNRRLEIGPSAYFTVKESQISAR